jgi:large subunit ribosomal protein L3
MDTLACGFADEPAGPGFFVEMAAKHPEKFMIATKMGMSQVYNEKGALVPVTLLQAEPNVVTQVKNVEKDGYAAVQIAVGKKKSLSKAMKGHFKGLGDFRYVREFKTMAVEGKDLAVGDKIGVQIFAPGDTIKVAGLTKGKGFAGAVKRHGFHGAPGSHGHHHVTRHVGSIGQRFPQHTLKGSRGPGRDGAERVTIRGLKVIAIDVENGILAVKGAVPGPKGAMLEVTTK